MAAEEGHRADRDGRRSAAGGRRGQLSVGQLRYGLRAGKVRVRSGRWCSIRRGAWPRHAEQQQRW